MTRWLAVLTFALVACDAPVAVDATRAAAADAAAVDAAVAAADALLVADAAAADAAAADAAAADVVRDACAKADDAGRATWDGGPILCMRPKR